MSGLGLLDARCTGLRATLSAMNRETSDVLQGAETEDNRRTSGELLTHRAELVKFDPSDLPPQDRVCPACVLILADIRGDSAVEWSWFRMPARIGLCLAHPQDNHHGVKTLPAHHAA